MDLMERMLEQKRRAAEEIAKMPPELRELLLRPVPPDPPCRLRAPIFIYTF